MVQEENYGKCGLPLLRYLHIFPPALSTNRVLMSDVKPLPSALPKDKLIFFLFGNLTRIIDLDHHPGGPYDLAPHFSRPGARAPADRKAVHDRNHSIVKAL